MAKTDTLNIRIETEVKVDVEKILNELGMNIADAVTIFWKQVVLTESIPFEIKKLKYNQETLEAINEAIEMLKNPNQYKAYESVSH